MSQLDSHNDMVDIFRQYYDKNFAEAIYTIHQRMIENFKLSVPTSSYSSDSKELIEKLRSHFIQLGYISYITEKEYNPEFEFNYKLNVSLNITYDKEGNVK